LETSNYAQPVGNSLHVTFPQNKLVASVVKQGEEIGRQDNDRKCCMWVI